LEGEAPLKEVEERFKIHRQFPGQVFDHFVDVTNVDHVNALRESDEFRVWLITDFCLLLLLYNDKSLLESNSFLLESSHHVEEIRVGRSNFGLQLGHLFIDNLI